MKELPRVQTKQQDKQHTYVAEYVQQTHFKVKVVPLFAVGGRCLHVSMVEASRGLAP